MAAELDALLANFANRGERKHLVATGIRQHGTIPRHELVYAAQALEVIDSGAEHQVVRVVEDDLAIGAGCRVPGAEIFQLLGGERFDRCGCANRHENGCVNDAV